MRKYNNLLLDEAVELSKSEGLRRASEITGVNRHSIIYHAKIQRARAGIKTFTGEGRAPKYTREQKDACRNLAESLVQAGHQKSLIKAFIAAGKELGVNGYSIYSQFVRGVAYSPFIQQPAAKAASSGGGPPGSKNAANPQGKP